MRIPLLATALLVASASSGLAFDEAVLKKQMNDVCAKVFAPGAACDNLEKGTRNCVRKNLSAAGPTCAEFEKTNKEFFDAGANDPMIKKN